MGGNALKKVKASRINLKIYDLIKQEILKTFESILSNNIAFPTEIPGKTDFGDLDILYTAKTMAFNSDEQNNVSFNLRDFIIETYKTPDIVTNGSVISFAYPFDRIKHLLETTETTETTDTTKPIYFQVDFIKTNNLKMGLFYFSYGDLGNILGRITKYHGLRLGDHGLFLNLSAETLSEYYEHSGQNICRPTDLCGNIIPYTTLAVSDEILLSIDPSKICLFLGLNYEMWQTSFLTLNDIFEWIKSTSLFSAKIFCETNLNYIHKEKIKIRPMYNKFVESLTESLTESHTKSHTESHTKSLNNLTDQMDKSNKPNKPNKQLESIFYFDKISDMHQIINNVQTKKIRNDKFNGSKLINLGIEQKQLGDYIKTFKSYIDDKFNMDFNEWIDNNDTEEIDKILNQFILKKIESIKY